MSAGIPCPTCPHPKRRHGTFGCCFPGCPCEEGRPAPHDAKIAARDEQIEILTRNLTETREEYARHRDSIEAEEQHLADLLGCAAKFGPIGHRIEALTRNLTEVRSDLAAERSRLALRADCHAGPGTTEPACNACTACLLRTIEGAEVERNEAQQRANGAETERDAIRAYLTMTIRLHAMIDEGAERSDEEDDLRDQMDEPWAQMDEAGLEAMRSLNVRLNEGRDARRGAEARANRAEARLVAVTGAVQAMADADPRMDGNTGDCWACGAGLDDEWQAYTRPHHPDCAWLALRSLLTDDNDPAPTTTGEPAKP